MSDAVETLPVQRFRVTVGPHIDAVLDPQGRKNPDGRKNAAGEPIDPLMIERRFHALGREAPPQWQPNYGAVVETTDDLTKYNFQGFPPKFERLFDGPQSFTQPITAEELARRGLAPNVVIAGPPSPPAEVATSPTVTAPATTPAGRVWPNLDALPAKELIAFAEAEEVALTGCKSHEDRLRVCKAFVARSTAQVPHG